MPCSPFRSCTVPRPIGRLSGKDWLGLANLVPCSQWQNLTFDPKVVLFAANTHADGRRSSNAGIGRPTSSPGDRRMAGLLWFAAKLSVSM